MSGGSCPDVATIVSNSNAFFNWIQNRQNCPSNTATDVYNRLLQYDAGSSNTAISTLEQQITHKKNELNTKISDANIAKDRASSMIRPELSSSYYDSWFPLNRPLKRASIPILVFFASLFITSAFFLLLGIFGIRSHFFMLVPDDTKGGTMTKPFFILLAFTIALFCLTIYAFMR